ncbi:MAG: glucokinase [Saprospiraceae bacterium]|nr:glucokinase [Saprospiraceae bacterium]
MNKPLIPVALPKRELLKEGMKILAADVGGTKTHLALFEQQDEQLSMVRDAIFPSAQYKSLEDIIVAFIDKNNTPQRLSIAFAGPVQDGRAKATNLDWQIDSRQLQSRLGISDVFIINDLEAEAYGLAVLKADDLTAVYAPPAPEPGNVAIIAPGTGLGEAGMFWDGHVLHPFATEGGHTDFSPRSLTDWEFLLFLQKKYGHVSWERIISGPGIHQIYNFLRDDQGWEESQWMKDNWKEHDRAAIISQGAQRGSALCLEALRLFVKYLAIESADMALKFKATGGLYIGGGIIPKIWNDELKAVFLEHFFEVGRLRYLLEAVPVNIVLNPKTPLLGAAYYAIGRFKD